MSKFKVGDRVRIAKRMPCWEGFTRGKEYVIVSLTNCGNVSVKNDEGSAAYLPQDWLELATPAPAESDDKALAWVKARLEQYAADPCSDHRVVYDTLDAMLEEVYGLRANIVPASVTFTPVGQA